MLKKSLLFILFLFFSTGPLALSMGIEEALEYVDKKIKDRGASDDEVKQIKNRVERIFLKLEDEDDAQRLAIDEIIDDEMEKEVSAKPELGEDGNSFDLSKVPSVPRELSKFRIYYVRGLHQENSWQCGHFTVYNAVKIQEMVDTADSRIDRSFLSKQFLPKQEYTRRKFKDFFESKTKKIYFKKRVYAGETNTIKDIDEAIEANNPNVLDLYDDDLRLLAVEQNLDNFYPVTFDYKKELQASFTMSSDLNKRVNDKEGFEGFIKSLALADKWAIHFACSFGHHWFLISVVKAGGDTSMLIMDSYPSVSGWRIWYRFANKLRSIFAISERTVEEIELEKSLLHKKLENAVKWFRAHPFWGSAVALAVLGTIIKLYRKNTTK